MSSLDLSIQFADINTTGKNSRMRRHHVKTRTGCRNCKRRKVKCDEERPCRGCTKRNEHCSLSNDSSTRSGRDAASQIASSPRRINLSHIKLFRHFEHVVVDTLVFDSHIWQDIVIPLALQHEFLMEVVLCIAATHLHYLNPTDEEYHEAELQHLSNAISGVRKTLQAPITQQNADALFGCSILLYYHAWASSDKNESDLAAEIGFGLGSMITLAHGPHSIFMQTFQSRTTVWDSMAMHSPRRSINEYVGKTYFPAELEQTFKKHFYECKSRDTGIHRFKLYMAECKRLIPVISVLKLSQNGVDMSPLLADVTRYLFTFPMLFGQGFLQLMKKRDESVQIVLTYYYAAVSGLMPDTCWWIRRRMQEIAQYTDSDFVKDVLPIRIVLPNTALAPHVT